MFFTTERKHSPEFVIISAAMDPQAVQIHVNGEIVNAFSLPQAIAFNKSHILTLGMEFDEGQPSDFLIGEVAEVLFFNSCLNSFYRSLIEQSLGAKYGINVTTGE